MLSEALLDVLANPPTLKEHRHEQRAQKRRKKKAIEAAPEEEEKIGSHQEFKDEKEEIKKEEGGLSEAEESNSEEEEEVWTGMEGGEGSSGLGSVFEGTRAISSEAFGYFLAWNALLKKLSLGNSRLRAGGEEGKEKEEQ